MFKKLFLFIFSLIMLVVASPFIVLALMYQGNAEENVPLNAYSEDASPRDAVVQELQDALEGLENPQDDLVLSLDDANVNAFIYGFLTGEGGVNPSYNPSESCDEDACASLWFESFELGGNQNATLRITAFWVEFLDDQLVVNVNASMQSNDRFTFPTQMSITFDVHDLDDAYYLAFDRITLGRLPLTQGLFNRIVGLVERVSGEDIQVDFPDLPVGTFEFETLSVTVLKEDIVSRIETSETNENGPLLAEALKIVFANQLVQFAFEENVFNLTLKTSLIVNEGPYVFPDDVAAVYDNPGGFDLQTELAGELETFLLSQALLNDSVFSIDQQIINQVLAQNLVSSGALDFTQSFTNTAGEVEEIPMRLQGAWFELSDLGLQMIISVQLDTVYSWIQLELSSVPSADAFSLIYTIDSLTMGQDALESVEDYVTVESFDAFLNALDEGLDEAFFSVNSEGQLVIEGAYLEASINDVLGPANITLTDLAVGDQEIALTLSFGPLLSGIFGAYSDALLDVLSNETLIASIETEMSAFDSPEVKEIIETINVLNDALQGDMDPSAETVNDFLDTYSALDSFEQAALMDSIESIIGEATSEDFNNLIPNS